MRKYDEKWACDKLSQLDPDQKFNTMIMTAAVLTKLLEKEQVKPIIVGGFSLGIYSDEQYTTRDIDIVVYERNKAIELLQKLGFKKGNDNLFHENLEVVIEFPDDKLDKQYMFEVGKGAENNKESAEIKKWFKEFDKLRKIF
ncbi:MAG: hypothetical protein SCJ97_02260 [Bacillota bacterium]|nr:hypothetical protein [Bacillota bacterium]